MGNMQVLIANGFPIFIICTVNKFKIACQIKTMYKSGALSIIIKVGKALWECIDRIVLCTALCSQLSP